MRMFCAEDDIDRLLDGFRETQYRLYLKVRLALDDLQDPFREVCAQATGGPTGSRYVQSSFLQYRTNILKGNGVRRILPWNISTKGSGTDISSAATIM